MTTPSKQEESTMLTQFFKLNELNTTVKTEIMAGITTFMTMSYIMFVNPSMLADVGMPKGAAFVATVIAASLTTYMMGLYANMPIGLAPGMGINAFFAYSVCLGMGLPWQTALGAVFISGIAFLILSVTNIRTLIINSVPMSLKLAISAGIGMFIAFIGLRGAGIVVDNPATLVALGDLSKPTTLLSIFGLILTAVLMQFRVKGAILFGILSVTVAGMIFGQGPVPHGVTEVISFNIPSVAPIFMQLDIVAAFKYGLFTVLFTLTMADLFDSVGTIIGLSRKAGLMSADGTIKGLNKALITDSCGTILSGFMGTPSVTSYVESCTGVAEGGRSGLTAVVVATLFMASLILAPLIGLVQGYATAPAMIIVGALMIEDVVHIDFKDITNGIPAFLTIITMPLTYSISTGFGMGFISYTLLKVLTKRYRELNCITVIVAICFAISFIIR